MSSSPTATPQKKDHQPIVDEPKYRVLVVDSGPIIRQTSHLRNRAQHYVTVPSVLAEIRDSSARQHLNTFLFNDLEIREASPEGIQAVVNFSRQTGDYQSLSSVDLQVLGLLYDMEKEGCGGVDHIRTEPKRKVGIGKIEALCTEEKKNKDTKEGTQELCQGSESAPEASVSFFEAADVDIVEDDEDDGVEKNDEAEEDEHYSEKPSAVSSGPKSWAMLVNPETASTALPQVGCGSLPVQAEASGAVGAGQFDDAEDDFNPSLEEQQYMASVTGETNVNEIDRAFPSLEASLKVPIDPLDQGESIELTPAIVAKQLAEKRKNDALKPATKSGKLYNSFGKYGDMLKPKEATADSPAEKKDEEDEGTEIVQNIESTQLDYNDGRSRIIGGIEVSGQGTQVEDDGEGWVTCTNDIRKMKAAGRLDTTVDPSSLSEDAIGANNSGPPIGVRAACSTTDFAMQNVILQMNMELLSVDGIKIRRLKSWVTRCGACYTVYTDGDNSNSPYKNKRLFCARCGSDMIQRIAASVDGKTGRLRLHLSKKYKSNIRGTKFALPKAGTNNRFKGDLLLREDQLMMGAWNTKVKKMSGGKSRGAAQSMFGSDLATNVSCHAKSFNDGDIRVGFGRRNPNSAKGGRERRGKKKKNGEKACGLRRY